MKQEPPFSIQIEPVEGCTLACWFCGLQAIRDNGADGVLAVSGKRSTPYKYMALATAQTIADELERLDWNPRIEFAMHGEPTLHSELPDMIAAFRRVRKGALSIMVTTNGAGVIVERKARALFDAGLNTLAIDDYKDAGYVPRIRAWIEAGGYDIGARDIAVFEYPQQREGNPHARTRGKRIVLINDIADNSKGTHQLTNQGGNSLAPLAEPLRERCAKPFREMSVRYDGRIAICCDDWRGQYIIDNVNSTPLDALWNHPRMHAARRALYHARRDLLTPCNVCSVRTYRNGLLPDKHGKLTLPAPEATK